MSACGGGGKEAPPPPQSLPPQSDPCALDDVIRTPSFGCLSPRDYRQQRQILAARHADRAGFREQWGLTAVRADQAWAQVELTRGAGVEAGSGYIAGLIDDGIDTGHPMFAGKTVTESIISGSGAGDRSVSSHGTTVASVLAGRPPAAYVARGAGPGIAPGADIAMLAIALRPGGRYYKPASLASLRAADRGSDGWGSLFTRAANWSQGGRKIDFVNASWGPEGMIEQYDKEELRLNLNQTITALAQAGAADKTVFVFSAGNAHDFLCNPVDFADNPDLCTGGALQARVNARSVKILPGLPVHFPELRGHVIAAAAVAPDFDGDGDYEITDFSNRCGVAAEWCIAAPGDAVRAAYSGPPCGDDPDCRAVSGSGSGTRGVATYVRGTSAAAPFVTGGLVVMKQVFRGQMTNTELVARMMATANKQGIYANSSIYGQGLMDLGAATAPVGAAMLTLGGRVDSPGSPVTETGFVPGGALGNGLAQALSGGGEVAAFDTLGAPFWYPLGGFVAERAGPGLANRLHAFMSPQRTGRTFATLQPGLVPLTDGVGAADTPVRLGFLGAAPFDGGGHLALAESGLAVDVPGAHGFAVTAFSTEGVHSRPPVSGAILTWRAPEQPFALTSGMVAERQTVLGSTASGAFGNIAGQSVFVGIEAEFRADAWHLGADAEIGTVRTATRGGMLAGISPLTTSAFGLRARRPLGERDTLTLSVSQPLRVEAGQARLSVPVGRTKDRRVLRRSMVADLEPSGRQFDMAAQWRRLLDNGSELRLDAGWSRQPGHDATAASELSILAGWRHAF